MGVCNVCSIEITSAPIQCDIFKDKYCSEICALKMAMIDVDLETNEEVWTCWECDDYE